MHHPRHSENFLSVRFPIHNHYRIARTHGNSDTKLQAPNYLVFLGGRALGRPSGAEQRAAREILSLSQG